MEKSISLEVKNISFKYDNNFIIKNISFDLKKDEFISIVGASGCGKSTIIKLIADILQIDSGEIIKKSTGYMPQLDLLLPWRTIIDNIILPMEIKKMDKKEAYSKALFLLEKVNLLDVKDKYPHELSGGMRQRISFVRTLLTDAEILLLDEPFSALDAINRENMQFWLLEVLKEFHKSVIFITHDINEAILLSDKILVCQNKPLDKLIEFIIEKNMNFNEKHILKEKILNLIRED